MSSQEDRITLFTVCDNHFAVLLAALLKSVDLNHESNELIDFYIVADNLTQKNRANLGKCVNPERIKILWIDIDDIIQDKSKLPLDGSSFPLIVYIRLFFPLFIPDNTRRVIYLDVDMIVRKDISLLWNTDLQGRSIGAVMDRAELVSSPWGGILNYKELGINGNAKYFNSGLLLIDYQKWVEADTTRKIIECIGQNTKYAFFPDQYGLNVIFAERWLELDPAWNSFSLYDRPDPFIIHFIAVKPIFTSYNYVERYKTEFFAYLKQTPWADFRPKSNYARLFKKLKNKLNKKLYQLKSSLFSPSRK
ncbi:MAG: hypothetical protein JNL22_01140 [Bacteroidales bacterium]|nr:hypothetical protein [Bacteroidales bacterium]